VRNKTDETCVDGGKMCVRERQRETERDRERQRETERETVILISKVSQIFGHFFGSHSYKCEY
jgi:hypothetical protein